MKEEYPRQVILITSRGIGTVLGQEKEKDNIMAASWHTPCSLKPRKYAICISKERFSYELIKNSNCFVVNFMPYKLKEKVNLCGQLNGAHVDKFDELDLAKVEAEAIDCPILKDCCAYLECQLEQEIELGDSVIFIGQVVNSELSNNEKRIFYSSSGEFTTTLI